MTGRGSALHGHLDLVCRADAAGRTALTRQSFAAPMHLSKPYWDGHHLIVNAVNPTAGLFTADTVRVDGRVEAGARLLLTSPSATRIHRARDGEPAALVRQRFTVCAGGLADVLPELLIAHARARFTQETELHVEPGGTLLYFDLLAPGRVAAGEVFAFEEILAVTRLFLSGELLAAERCRLRPDDGSLDTLRLHHAHSYHASWYAVFPRPVTDLPARIAAANGPETLVGASALAPGAWAGKILAADSPALRRAVGAVRGICYAVLGLPEPKHRKL